MTPAEPVTRIFLARHGEASYDEGGASGGTLTERGHSQANALADRLREEEVAAVYCSTLSRSAQTAAIVAEAFSLPVRVQQGLQEYQLGDQTHDASLLPHVLLGWIQGNLAGRVPGGETGDQVAGRMVAALDQIVQRHRGQTVLVVSHGGAILATLGSISPGKTGLPGESSGHFREQDFPGGTSFSLENTAHGWRLSAHDAQS